MEERSVLIKRGNSEFILTNSNPKIPQSTLEKKWEGNVDSALAYHEVVSFHDDYVVSYFLRCFWQCKL